MTDCSYVDEYDDSPHLADLKCMICLKTLNHPVMHSCGEMFCLACACSSYNSPNTSQACPFCKDDFNFTVVPKAIHKQLGDELAKCNRCSKEMKTCEFTAHFNQVCKMDHGVRIGQQVHVDMVSRAAPTVLAFTSDGTQIYLLYKYLAQITRTMTAVVRNVEPISDEEKKWSEWPMGWDARVLRPTMRSIDSEEESVSMIRHRLQRERQVAADVRRLERQMKRERQQEVEYEAVGDMFEHLSVNSSGHRPRDNSSVLIMEESAHIPQEVVDYFVPPGLASIWGWRRVGDEENRGIY
jgi:hypothetical protein